MAQRPEPGRGERKPNDEVAAIVAPPPLIYGLGLSAGLLAEWLAPRSFVAAGGRGAATILGAVLIAGALIWIVVAERALAAAGTPVQPWRATRALVDRGPYALSRNPLYLGMSTALVGVALTLDNAWLLAALGAVVPVIRWGVVGPEERYLQGKFGAAYDAYRARVRRWVGRRSAASG